MLEVEIINYKTIKHEKFVVSEYTTLLGRNFIGKSAIVGAINAALTNKAGNSFIRWGETYCEVRLKHDGLDLLWHKEEGNNFYLINGREYLKIGRDVPEELVKLGYGPQAVGNQKVHFLYAQQFQPLFLVDDTDSEYVTDLMSAIFKIDVIYKAQELCKKDLKSDRGLLRIRGNDLKAKERALETYGDFQALTDKASLIESLEVSARSSIQELESLEAIYSKYQDNLDLCKRLKPVVSQPAANPTESEELLLSVIGLQQLQAKLSSAKARVVALRDVPELPSRVDDAERALHELGSISSLESLDSRKRALENRIEQVGAVGGIRKITVDDTLASELSMLEPLGHRYGELSARFKELSKVRSVGSADTSAPESYIGEVATLQDLYTRLEGAKGSLLSIKSDYEETLRIHGDLEKELGEFHQCPVCGSDL